MAESLKGHLQGNVITLDGPVPPLEGRRVHVVIELAEESDRQLSPTAKAQLWQAWVDHGPQGPIDEEDSDFP
ncbi:MAG TPA: hypothetical protein VIA62_14290 [Thermoanaerobaculia bacterium]|jgi:hypothetical protein|nr:hypothetical protein [Thermoanaerobaculia bacterium]